MDNFKRGNAPGLDTSIEKAAGVSQDSKRLKNDTSNATKIIAIYARIKAAVVRFCTWMAVAARGLS